MRARCRFFALRDQEGVPRLLPTFLQPLVPPKDVINRRDEEYMWAEEAAYKPNTAWEMFQYVQMIEFAEEHQFNTVEGGAVEREEDVVLAPPFLLDMRKGACAVGTRFRRAEAYQEQAAPPAVPAGKPDPPSSRAPAGDVRDHALLLACIFLGLGLDAYVCVGRARRPKPNKPTELEEVPHYWVMTREDHNACCGEDKATAWYTNNGAVRFWEVSRGRCVECVEWVPLPWRSLDHALSRRVAACTTFPSAGRARTRTTGASKCSSARSTRSESCGGRAAC